MSTPTPVLISPELGLFFGYDWYPAFDRLVGSVAATHPEILHTRFEAAMKLTRAAAGADVGS